MESMYILSLMELEMRVFLLFGGGATAVVGQSVLGVVGVFEVFPGWTEWLHHIQNLKENPNKKTKIEKNAGEAQGA